MDESATEPITLEMRERMPLTAKRNLEFQAYKPFLDAFHNYTTSLSNFFQQSVDVMVLNPRWGGR